MAEETKQPDLIDKPDTEKIDPATPVKPKPTEVLPKVNKPIEVNRPVEKEVKPVAKDPKGMFDYSNCKQYVVQAGDTLLDVAQKYVVALQQLRYFNHLDKGNPVIRPGKTLYIPDKPINVPYGE